MVCLFVCLFACPRAQVPDGPLGTVVPGGAGGSSRNLSFALLSLHFSVRAFACTAVGACVFVRECVRLCASACVRGRGRGRTHALWVRACACVRRTCGAPKVSRTYQVAAVQRTLTTSIIVQMNNVGWGGRCSPPRVPLQY